MFTASFDASGHLRDNSQPFLVVAGFVSHADSWIKFDAAWSSRLAADGISCFHMVDFAASRGDFKDGWRNNEPRRKKLLEDLLDIIRTYTFRWFGSIVENENLTSLISKRHREQYYYNAFSLAARTCMHRVDNWCSREKINSVVNFVFEDGDFGRGELIKQLDKFSHFPKPDFRPKKDKIKNGRLTPGFSPLQAADFLAYEIRIACGKKKTVGYHPRWAMEEFSRLPLEPVTVWNIKSLKDFEAKLGMFEALKNWPPA